MTRLWAYLPRENMEADAATTARTLAPAKVNLVLRIGAKRGDGFHELITIFQAVSLADEVEVEFHPVDRSVRDAANEVNLVVDGPDLGPVEQNLAWRAASAFLGTSGHRGAVSIHLTKHVPAGAGLGGGSSDAAAVLRCLAALSGFADRDALHQMASRLGSDITFFLGTSPTAIGRGRGERIEAVAALPERRLALALPPVHVATGFAYEALAASRAGAPPVSLPKLDALVSWDELLNGLAVNDFETTVAAANPPVAQSLAALRGAGARLAMLSGSGAASFGLFCDARAAADTGRECATLSRSLGWPVISCATLTRMPDVDLK
ncbi:MAG: 4-(cytidine 5'-diphospho)-2-C-methyl-D-erythritol kinase [Longimicrobiales bacterium]|nr:4-(cytidine 5'-diphospho)-2-C-methyl-D-erythritol kinase [Longimicrobiales bacterium]